MDENDPLEKAAKLVETWPLSKAAGLNHQQIAAAIRELKPSPKPDLATDIPMDDCGLYINTGRDGTWLHFDASNGQACSINVDVMAARADGIRASALHQWCSDRLKQADQIKADNGQFGVGA